LIVPEPLADALAALRPLLLDEQRLVRAVAAGRRRGRDLTWRRAEVRPVDLKAGRRLQVVRYDERQAHTENLAYDSAAPTVDALLDQPFGKLARRDAGRDGAGARDQEGRRAGAPRRVDAARACCCRR
jgi:hypothetical protein